MVEWTLCVGYLWVIHAKKNLCQRENANWNVANAMANLYWMHLNDFTESCLLQERLNKTLMWFGLIRFSERTVHWFPMNWCTFFCIQSTRVTCLFYTQQTAIKKNNMPCCEHNEYLLALHVKVNFTN